MTTLSPAEFLGIVTLAPLVIGAILIALGLFQRLTRRWALGLSAVGALIPIVGLPFLAPEVAFGDPISVRPFGLGQGFTRWIAPTYRVDTLALVLAICVAYVVTPLMLWMALAEHSETAAAASPEPATPDADTAEDAASAPMTDAAALAPRPLFLTLGLTLAVASALLTLLFADSIVLSGVAWLLAVALGWAVGEAASDGDTMDRLGLLAMLPGPILWLLIMLFPAVAADSPRFIELTGRTAVNQVESILLAVALALAGGAYPAVTWVRRRAALATPAGIAAIVLALLPAALYVAARTYAVATDASNRWPLFTQPPQTGTAPPPITAGIAFVLLGAVTVIVSAVLALGRRDGRALVALLATAQVGWGLVGIGSGQPASILGVALLLPVALLGLGAMLAALVAGGTLTSDIEPDADGPRPIGAPVRPLSLAAWSIGAAGLVGMPFLAGFAPRHLIGAGALQVGTLTIPLTGLCWTGDVLLGLAVLRATAPALADWATNASELALRRRVIEYLPDLPAVALAALVVVIGISPALFIGWFGRAAAALLLVPGSLPQSLTLALAGYSAGSIQWFSGVAWLVFALVVAAALLIARPSAARAAVPVFRGGLPREAPAETAPEQPAAIEAQPPDAEEERTPALSDPEVAWSDLRPAFASAWMLPAGQWLLAGIDDEEGDDAKPDKVAAGDEDESVTVSAAHGEAPHGDD